MCLRQVQSILVAMTMMSIVMKVESTPLTTIDDFAEYWPKTSKKASAKGTKAPIKINPKKKLSKKPFLIDDYLQMKPKLSKKAPSPKGTMAPTKKSIKKQRAVDSFVIDEMEFGFFSSMSMSMPPAAVKVSKKGISSKKLRFGKPNSKGGSTRAGKQPTFTPTAMPSSEPSATPSKIPTVAPSNEPSVAPTPLPSSHPSSSPTRIPSNLPTLQDSAVPSTSFPTPSATVQFPDDDQLNGGQNNTDDSTGDDDAVTDDINDDISNNSTILDDDVTSNNSTGADDGATVPDTSIGGTGDNTSVTPFIAGVVGLFILILGSFAFLRKNKNRSGASRPPSVEATL